MLTVLYEITWKTERGILLNGWPYHCKACANSHVGRTGGIRCSELVGDTKSVRYTQALLQRCPGLGPKVRGRPGSGASASRQGVNLCSDVFECPSVRAIQKIKHCIACMQPLNIAQSE